MFSKLFKPKPAPKPIEAYAKLNMRIGPKARAQMFEDALAKAFEETGLGAITGGGTKSEESRGGDGSVDGVEMKWCAIDVHMADADQAAQLICKTLNRKGAAKGSQLEFYVDEQRYVADFGVSEGIALYLNGTMLPEGLQDQISFDTVIDQVQAAIDSEAKRGGAVVETWHGPTESAMYMYGVSAELMKRSVERWIATNPWGKVARVVVIA